MRVSLALKGGEHDGENNLVALKLLLCVNSTSP